MSLKDNSSTNSSDPLVTEQDCHAEVAHVVGELLTSVAGETQESASCTLNMSSVTRTTQNNCQEPPKNDKNCFEHSGNASTSISMLSDVANDTSQPSKPADVSASHMEQSASPKQPLVASFSVDMQKTYQVYQSTVKNEKPLSDSISATNSHVGNTNTINVIAGDASNISSTSMQKPMQSDCGISDKPPSKTFDSSVNEKVASSSLATSDLQSFSEMQQQEPDGVSDVESSSTSEDESSVVELNIKVEVTDVVDEPIKSKVGPTVPGEITLYDLPPIEDLKIAIDENVELVELGVVMNIVDCLVIIKANPGTPALDEDTALFSVERKCVGKVFETFGPVICPFYSIRYNSVEDIIVSDVKVTQTIFYAPKEEKSLTTYVFVDRLRNVKGSDASWKENHEPPEQHIDYSDDEQERNAKAKLRSKNRKPTVENTEGGDNFKKSRHSDAPFHRPSHRGAHRTPRPAAMSHHSAFRPMAPHNTFSGPPCYPAPPPNMGGHYWHPYSASGSTWRPQAMPRWSAPYYNYDWSSYGSPWTQQDSQYYCETPPKPPTFVDTRYVQQADYNTPSPDGTQ